MRVIAALGGNALLERGERPDSVIQQEHITRAAAALAPLAREHELIITHGNGPQVGLLAMESASDPALSRPYPFDALGAQTQGLIGYWLVQELQNALPGRLAGCLVTRTLVSPGDPAFAQPTKFVGPVYDEATARRLAGRYDWQIRQDGAAWRRVVPSPEPVELLDLPLIRGMLDAGAVVVCAGGGGIPVTRDAAGIMHGAEAVVDKDLTAALLGHTLGAAALLLLTDVDGVQDDYGTSAARPIRRASAADLRARAFPAGSMGPKVAAACRFVEASGGLAAIGRLVDAEALLGGRCGTIITA
ncbi:MAG: carbamate kinase [Actinomycetota bacterium]